jgi:hypothetical protein
MLVYKRVLDGHRWSMLRLDAIPMTAMSPVTQHLSKRAATQPEEMGHIRVPLKVRCDFFIH